MRTAIWTLMLCCAAAMMGALPAVGREYPFWLQGCDFPGNGDCSFSSYQQCQATVSGRDGYCSPNPHFKVNDGPQPDSSRRTQRKY